MATYISANIGDDLLPDDSKPLPEPMFISHQ